MRFSERIRNFFKAVPREINLFHLVSLVISMVALASALSAINTFQSLQAEAYFRGNESTRVEKTGVLGRRRSWRRYRGDIYYLRNETTGRVVVQRIVFLNRDAGSYARQSVGQLVTISGWDYRNGIRFYADNIWLGGATGPTPTPRPTPTPTQPPGVTATPRPTQTPTPTGGPTATPRPTISPGTGSGPVMSIGASAYSQLKDYLLPGDHVEAGNISDLRSIDKNEKGILKGVIMRSIGDLESALQAGDLPGDIDYVAYNMESFTPDGERADPVGSVRTFVQICHNNGLKMMYIPLRGFWHNQSDSTLKAILDDVDMIDYQAQKVLGSEGNECAQPGCPASCTSVDECISTVRDISNKLRGIHPAEDFVMGMQLWVRRCDNPPDAMAQCINGLKGYLDLSMLAGIYSEVGQAEQVLQSLDWR